MGEGEEGGEKALFVSETCDEQRDDASFALNSNVVVAVVSMITHLLVVLVARE